MKTSLKLVAGLNSYARVSGQPTRKQTYKGQLLSSVESANIQDYDITRGFGLIDRSVQQNNSIENLRQVLLFSNTSFESVIASYAKLNTGVESKVIFPYGKKTSLSASIEVLATITTLISYGIAIALLAVVGKIFMYMTKRFYNACKAVVNVRQRVEKSSNRLSKQADFLKSKETVSIPNVEKWEHASKIPALLNGKSGTLTIKAAALSEALIKEWLTPQIKTYARVYHHDPATYKILIREAKIAGDLLVDNVDNMDNLAKYLQGVSKGGTNDPRQQISLLNQMTVISGKVRKSMVLFKDVHDKYDRSKIPLRFAEVPKNIAAYKYDPPTSLLKTNDKLKALESRLNSISKTLEQGRGKISKDVDTAVSQELSNIKNAIQDMYNQVKYIDMLFTHNVTFSMAYLDYLSVMHSVDWSGSKPKTELPV